MKSIMMICTVVIIFVITQPFLLFGEQTLVDGVNKPVISSPIVISHEGNELDTFSLTPNLSYDISVTVTDDDGVLNPEGGLDELIVKLWYDEAGNAILSEKMNIFSFEDKSNFDNKDALNPSNYVKIRWVRGGTAILRGGGRDWSLNLKKCVLPSQENLRDTEFEFVFNITVGRKARHSSGKSKWQIVAKATDVDSHVDYRAYKQGAMIGVKMDFYCEVIVDSRRLPLEDIDEQIKLSDIKESIGEVEYISNYYYDSFYVVDGAMIGFRGRDYSLESANGIENIKFSIASRVVG